MRAVILGAAIDDPHALRDYVRVSSRITHTDPKAEFGAFAIALAAHVASHDGVIAANAYLDRLRASLDDDASELIRFIADAITSVNKGQTTEEFAASCGLSAGVSGYIYHSVPIAVHAWLAHPHDFRSAIMSAVVIPTQLRRSLVASSGRPWGVPGFQRIGFRTYVNGHARCRGWNDWGSSSLWQSNPTCQFGRLDCRSWDYLFVICSS